MKIIIKILLLLLLISCGPKLDYELKSLTPTRSLLVMDTAYVQVDNGLLPYTLEFLEEALKYDIEITHLTNFIDSIVITDQLEGVAGLTFTPDNNSRFSIVINKNIMGYDRLKRVVIYHELSHFYLQRRHCHYTCREIMSAIVGINTDMGVWEEQKKLLFMDWPHNYTVK